MGASGTCTDRRQTALTNCTEMKVSPPSGPVIRVISPLKKDIRTIRILIVMAFACLSCFVIWFADPGHIGYGPIFWVLTCALLFKLVKMVHEWYHYWSP